MELEYILLALAGGGLGSLIGGIQIFIITGFVGLVSIFAHNQFFSQPLLIPAIVFNGAVVATAYASKKYQIKGFDISQPLVTTEDPLVFIFGALGGFIGYCLFHLASFFQFPFDPGAFSIVVVGTCTRCILGSKQLYNHRGLVFLEEGDKRYWIYLVLFALSISYLTGYLTLKTKDYALGFSLSAFSLVFSLHDAHFPTTHHITLIAGYTMIYTHDMLLTLLFGVLAETICDLFARVFNTDCGTHIDPPAVSILLCSFLLLILFKGLY
ncbi:MAG: hypothetical protein PUE27_08170 [Sharpea porci]|uniref:hypothetical protein n=1 Tax=Sharpea porci TaxID=2652286 RepID=UPI00240960B7|nr:hypothetical protein [Sharpea porci]MDD6712038.1 hypothetical protein [Sharpea porci]